MWITAAPPTKIPPTATATDAKRASAASCNVLMASITILITCGCGTKSIHATAMATAPGEATNPVTTKPAATTAHTMHCSATTNSRGMAMRPPIHPIKDTDTWTSAAPNAVIQSAPTCKAMQNAKIANPINAHHLLAVIDIALWMASGAVWMSSSPALICLHTRVSARSCSQLMLSSPTGRETVRTCPSGWPCWIRTERPRSTNSTASRPSFTAATRPKAIASDVDNPAFSKPASNWATTSSCSISRLRPSKSCILKSSSFL